MVAAYRVNKHPKVLKFLTSVLATSVHKFYKQKD